MIDVLAISGSLRAASKNTALLEAAVRVAPQGMRVRRFRGLGSFPLFNPDTEFPTPPPVADFIAQIAAADALLIASPEYAHGVTGVMKNALDWVVSSPAFIDKPVALVNASPRATIAYGALRETLVTMSARMIEGGCVTIAVPPMARDAEGVLAVPDLVVALRSALAEIQRATQ